MKTSRVETLIWVLIYGGMIAVGLGIAVQRSQPAFGWTLGVGGGIVATVGAVLIWVRSRMKEEG